MGKESKKEWIYAYVQLVDLLYSRNKYNIVNQLHPNNKKNYKENKCTVS